MYRKSILEFIANSFNELANIHIIRMYLTITNKQIVSHPLKELFNLNQIYLYNINLPRIDKKIIDQIINNDELNYNNTKITIYSKNELSSYKDIYNNKLLDELTFSSLIIIPYLEDDIVISRLFIYSELSKDTLNQIFNPFIKNLNTSLKNLTKELLTDEIDDLTQELSNITTNDYFVKSLTPPGLIYHYVNNSYKILHNNGRIIPKNKLPNKIININNQQFELYILNSMMDIINNIMSKEYINEYLNSIEDNYSLLFIETLNLNNLINILESKVKTTYQIFKQDNHYLIIVNDKYNKISFKHDFSNLSYSLIINNNEINKKMDIIKLFDYIFETKKETYNREEYLEYQYIKEQTNYDITHQIENFYAYFSNNIDHIYRINNYVNGNKKTNQKILQIEHIIKQIDKYKKTESKLMIFIDINNIDNKKIINLSKTNEVYLVLHKTSEEITDDNRMNLVKLFSNGHHLILDSSIYLSLKDYDIMPYIEGLYLRKDEYLSLMSNKDMLEYLIFNYFLRNLPARFNTSPKSISPSLPPNSEPVND